MKRTFACTLLLASASTSALLLPGCAATKPEPAGPKGSFSVEVQPYFGPDVKVYAEAFPLDGGGNRGPRVALNHVTGDGVTGFVLPIGKKYSVRAFADLDGDKRCGPNDPAATLSDLRPETNPNSSHIPPVLTISTTGAALPWPQKKPEAPAQEAGIAAEPPPEGGVAPVTDEPAPLPVPPPPPPTPANSLPIPPLPIPPPP